MVISIMFADTSISSHIVILAALSGFYSQLLPCERAWLSIVSMVVPVVKVRPVRMLMFNRLMDVSMRVNCGRRTVMLMAMMTVIVTMPVFVYHSFMTMNVPMMFAE